MTEPMFRIIVSSISLGILIGGAGAIFWVKKNYHPIKRIRKGKKADAELKRRLDKIELEMSGFEKPHDRNAL